MSMDFKRRLPIPQELKAEMPLSAHHQHAKRERDAQIARIMFGRDDRLLIIVGPCSADREDAVLEYCERLARLQERVAEKLLLIPRLYTNKPRTLGVGYKGMLHQPDPHAEADVLEGIKAIRRLNLHVIEATGLFGADEMLYPQQHRFVSDVLSYLAVGARSVENQEHRLLASGLDIPVGMKNPLSGSLDALAHAVFAAQQPQSFIYRNWEVESTGNPAAHCILRGFINETGDHANVSQDDLCALLALCRHNDIVNPAVIVDCNHSNSGKRPELQPRIAHDIMNLRAAQPELASFIKGFMVESYLESGCQDANGSTFGQSITDPCLGWEDTEQFLLNLAQA